VCITALCLGKVWQVCLECNYYYYWLCGVVQQIFAQLPPSVRAAPGLLLVITLISSSPIVKGQAHAKRFAESQLDLAHSQEADTQRAC
jgi:hypothetical protein